MRDHAADATELVQYGEQSIARGSKSFGMAATLFKPQVRADVVMLYAWCRHADDLIDGQAFGHDQDPAFRKGQHGRLEDLKRRTAAVLNGERIGDPAFDGLGEVVRGNDIPHRLPEDLITGFEMDVSERDYPTLTDTLTYCYHVAGDVGVMMAMVMGARRADVLDRACDLGIAFQLTNIARDVMDDAHAGRRYVPADLLARRGLTPEDYDAPENRATLFAVVCDMLDEADRYYASAQWGLSELDWRSAWAIASAARVYRAIGEKLRRGGPGAWKRRIATSLGAKVWLITLALGDTIGSRFRSVDDAPARRGLYTRPTVPS